MVGDSIRCGMTLQRELGNKRASCNWRLRKSTRQALGSFGLSEVTCLSSGPWWEGVPSLGTYLGALATQRATLTGCVGYPSSLCRFCHATSPKPLYHDSTIVRSLDSNFFSTSLPWLAAEHPTYHPLFPFSRLSPSNTTFIMSDDERETKPFKFVTGKSIP